MKRLLLLISVLGLLVFATQAGAMPLKVQSDSVGIKTLVFAGVRHYADTTSFSAGIGQNLTGHLWLFSLANFGAAKTSLPLEIGGIWKLPLKLPIYGGVLAGADADWQANGNEPDPISYITGAAGIIAAYHLGSWGAWGYFKGKFLLTHAEKYKEGFAFGFGAYFRLSL